MNRLGIPPIPRKALCAILSCIAFISFGFNNSDAQPRADYSAVAGELERLIAREMQDKKLPAFSIALDDNQETVWARGFGMEDPDRKIPATAETVYRVGSVSKLFTDIGIMQLVERGVIDLDAPVTNYLPNFQPNNPLFQRRNCGGWVCSRTNAAAAVHTVFAGSCARADGVAAQQFCAGTGSHRTSGEGLPVEL